MAFYPHSYKNGYKCYHWLQIEYNAVSCNLYADAAVLLPSFFSLHRSSGRKRIFLLPMHHKDAVNKMHPAPQCKWSSTTMQEVRVHPFSVQAKDAHHAGEATGGHRRPQEATGQFGSNGSWENAFFCDGFKPPLKKKHLGWISSICAPPPRQSVAPNLKFKPLLLEPSCRLDPNNAWITSLANISQWCHHPLLD